MAAQLAEEPRWVAEPAEESGMAKRTWAPGHILATLAAVASCALVPPAVAHPHVWIFVEATVLYDKGTFSGLEQTWTFDEYYAATAIEGLDKNKDGKFDREELAELAKVNMDGLKDFAYFTFPALAGQELKLGEARDYWFEYTGGRLSLHFILPFAQPVLAEAKGLTFSVQDPTYFIAFEFVKRDPVKLGKGTPKGCKVAVGQPPQDSAATDALQRQFGAFAMQSKVVAVDCGGP
jgi:ABC-type uncharacterized transport system substrate-binding protein